MGKISAVEGDFLDEKLKEIQVKAANLQQEDIMLIAAGEGMKREDILSYHIHGIDFYPAFTIDGAIARPVNADPGMLGMGLMNVAKQIRVVDIEEAIKAGPDHFGEVNYITVDEWDPDKGYAPLWALTRPDHTFGAAVMLCTDILRKIYDKIGSFRLIPSSIHEVIITPAMEEVPVEVISKMVKEINSNELAEYDRLADRAFTYDGMRLR